MIGKRRQRYHSTEIAPDEILLDSQNLPEFNNQQFEGVMERPIKKLAIVTIMILFGIILTIMSVRLGFLQIAKGGAYLAQSENNRLHETLIFTERGIIYDRNGVELAWNEQREEGEEFSYRKYISDGGFAHLLGYVRHPRKDSSGYWWKTATEGAANVEEWYNDLLGGVNGLKLVETNVFSEVQSESVVNPPKDGDNLTLTIDAGVQAELYRQIKALADEFGYTGGSGLMIDIHTGELIALTNYPEFDPEVLSLAKDKATIDEYFQDSRKPFLNRAVSGLFVPGSVVKPFIAAEALQRGIVSTKDIVYSTGSISIPNPYDPEKPTIFSDWRPEGHGPTDFFHAIADSVNSYFYTLGGGLNGHPALGIQGIEDAMSAFGFDRLSGIAIPGEVKSTIPTPEWKESVFGEPWRLGDTLNSVIGQFGMSVTPIAVLEATTAIANGGLRVTPIFVEDGLLDSVSPNISIRPDVLATVRTAMRETVTNGTAGMLNVPYVKIAGKTGTAQVGARNEFFNSWSIGFFPYESPRYAYVVVMERGPNNDVTRSASWAVRGLIEWMYHNAPEYFSLDPAP